MRDAFSRRDLIIGVAAIGAASLGGGGMLVATADAKALLLDFFKRTLSGVEIDEESAKKCIEQFMVEWSEMKIHLVGTTWKVTSVETMAELNEKFDVISRRALTFFLLNSNFFKVPDPRGEPIVYVATSPGAACTNPFANLAPP